MKNARRRGVPILAYLVGGFRQSEGYKITATHSSGSAYAAVMQGALKSASLQTQDIQHINAHGTSTPLNDAAESRAIKSVFYQNNSTSPTVTSTKSSLGHSLAASGAVEALLCIESLCQQKVLPTLNFSKPGPDEPLLSIVKQGANQSVNHIMSNSFGFWGECIIIFQEVTFSTFI